MQKNINVYVVVHQWDGQNDPSLLYNSAPYQNEEYHFNLNVAPYITYSDIRAYVLNEVYNATGWLVADADVLVN